MNHYNPSVSCFSLIPNTYLCAGAEIPKQRVKLFIQALLRKNDLDKVCYRCIFQYKKLPSLFEIYSYFVFCVSHNIVTSLHNTRASIG